MGKNASLARGHTEPGSKTTILINRRPFHLDDPEVTAPILRDLVDAPSDHEAWQVVRSPDPEGQLPIDDVQVNGTVLAKNGDRFRVVPPGTFGAGDHS